jgi:hypothetical protein
VCSFKRCPHIRPVLVVPRHWPTRHCSPVVAANPLVGAAKIYSSYRSTQVCVNPRVRNSSVTRTLETISLEELGTHSLSAPTQRLMCLSTGVPMSSNRHALVSSPLGIKGVSSENFQHQEVYALVARFSAG